MIREGLGYTSIQHRWRGSKAMNDNTKDTSISKAAKALSEVIAGYSEAHESYLKDMIEIGERDDYVSPLLLLSNDMRSKCAELLKNSDNDENVMFYMNIVAYLERYDYYLKHKHHDRDEETVRMMSYVGMVTAIIMMSIINDTSEYMFSSVNNGEHKIDVHKWLTDVALNMETMKHDETQYPLMGEFNQALGIHSMFRGSYRAGELLAPTISLLTIMHHEVYGTSKLGNAEQRFELYRSAILVAREMFMLGITNMKPVLGEQYIGEHYNLPGVVYLLAKENAHGVDYTTMTFFERSNMIDALNLDEDYSSLAKNTMGAVVLMGDILTDKYIRNIMGDKMDQFEEFIGKAIITTALSVFDHVKESIGIPRLIDSVVQEQIDEAVATYDEKYSEGETQLDTLITELTQDAEHMMNKKEKEAKKLAPIANALADIVRSLKRYRVHMSESVEEEAWRTFCSVTVIAVGNMLSSLTLEYMYLAGNDLLSIPELHDAIFYDGLIRVQVVNPQDTE